jgi:hypothetical protein
MPDPIIPPHRPPQLAPAETRQLAAATITATVPGTPARAASMTVDAPDAAVWAMLGALVLTPREAVALAAVLWDSR